MKIKLECSEEQAEQILRNRNFQGLLAGTGEIDADGIEASATAAPDTDRTLARDLNSIDLNAEGAPQLLAQALRAALRRERLLRPWQRLRWLFSPYVRFSPGAHVIGESDQRAYATQGLLAERRKPLLADLSMAVIVWPLFTALLLTLTLLPFHWIFPWLSLTPCVIGVLTGVILALAGAQVCSTLISPIACGAGGIGMGWSFGLAHALVTGKFGASGPDSPFRAIHVRNDLFISVAGGPIGLSAPLWSHGFPLPLILFLLTAVAVSIATAGWLMGQPSIAAGKRNLQRDHGHPHRIGIGCGIVAGAGIGLVFGLTQVLLFVFQGKYAEPAAFSAAFGLVGGTVFGLTTWARTNSKRRGVALGVLHFSLSQLLCLLIMNAPEGLPLLIALSVSSAYFHATWFTAAFVLGEKRGSIRSAVTATSVEGAVGFTVFVILRILHAAWVGGTWQVAAIVALVLVAVLLVYTAWVTSAKQGEGLVKKVLKDDHLPAPVPLVPQPPERQPWYRRLFPITAYVLAPAVVLLVAYVGLIRPNQIAVRQLQSQNLSLNAENQDLQHRPPATIIRTVPSADEAKLKEQLKNSRAQLARKETEDRILQNRLTVLMSGHGQKARDDSRNNYHPGGVVLGLVGSEKQSFLSDPQVSANFLALFVPESIKPSRKFDEIARTMGGPTHGNTESISLLSPVKTVVENDRPVLRWKPVEGATTYQVTVASLGDDKTGGLTIIVSPTEVSGTEFQIPRPLVRGKIYQWEVETQQGGKTFRTIAEFEVMEQSKFVVYTRIENTYRLAQIDLKIKAGLIEDARRELQAIPVSDPLYAAAQKRLKKVQEPSHQP